MKSGVLLECFRNVRHALLQEVVPAQLQLTQVCVGAQTIGERERGPRAGQIRREIQTAQRRVGAQRVTERTHTICLQTAVGQVKRLQTELVLCQQLGERQCSRRTQRIAAEVQQLNLGLLQCGRQRCAALLADAVVCQVQRAQLLAVLERAGQGAHAVIASLALAQVQVVQMMALAESSGQQAHSKAVQLSVGEVERAERCVLLERIGEGASAHLAQVVV
mmetsp:Transcript_10052/g.25108  ORF Transcript_10052/g.25108 Transcript_10052/m.25108 type:complete len:220 (-) Transcript_10052:1150-1809(-)